MNILFVSSTRIGDAVLSTGLLAHLIETYPDARLTVACGHLPAPLFRQAPRVEKVIELHKRYWAGHWLGLWAKVAGTAWDLVVDLRGSALAWTIWTKQRRVSRRADSSLHRVEALARLMDLDAAPGPRIWLSDAAQESANKIMGGGRTVLALGPTANWAAKVWPSERFIDLMDHLTGPEGIFRNASIAVFGGPGEEAIARPILQAIPPERCIDLVGTADILTVAACLKRADFFVGNDSGLMHIAAATGTPTVGLFGPSRREHYAPWGENCAVAETESPFETLVGDPDFNHLTSGTLMTSLSVDRVVTAAEELWHRAKKAT